MLDAVDSSVVMQLYRYLQLFTETVTS